jgi:hypothetical protein
MHAELTSQSLLAVQDWPRHMSSEEAHHTVPSTVFRQTQSPRPAQIGGELPQVPPEGHVARDTHLPLLAQYVVWGQHVPPQTCDGWQHVLPFKHTEPEAQQLLPQRRRFGQHVVPRTQVSPTRQHPLPHAVTHPQIPLTQFCPGRQQLVPHGA